MKQMGWSWDELQATPVYVRRYVADHLQLLGEAEAQAADEAERAAKK